MRDHQFAFGERESGKKIRRRPHRQLGHFGDGALGDLHRQTLRLETRAVATFAPFQQREIFVFRCARRHRVADAIASGARPMRAVEGEDPRRNLGITHSALDTRQLVTIDVHFARLREHPDQSPSQLHRCFDGIRDPSHQRIAWLHHQPIDDDLDVVLFLLVEDDVVAEINDLAVDSRPDIPGLPHLQ